MFLLKKWPRRLLLLGKLKSDYTSALSQIFDTGTERKTQNPAGDNSGSNGHLCFVAVAHRDDLIVFFSYPILSCFWKMLSISGPNHGLVDIVLSVSESVLWFTTNIFVLCLFCLTGQNNCWSYFPFSWTRLTEIVMWQVWIVCPA